jgi:prepilin-type N-terminal cleavage/methylation domain-containing protein
MNRNHYSQGFTLIELLTVLAILVAIATIGIQNFSGVDNQSGDSLVRTEMLRIAESVKQFKNDTGFWPRTGVFARELQGGLVSDTINENWFRSPANFSQLFVEPVDGALNPIMPWDMENSKGWRGPYLSNSSEGVVDIGDECRFDGTDSAGTGLCDPLGGTILNDIPAIADPYTAEPVGNYLAWQSVSSATILVRGRPYLLFIDDGAADPVVAGCIVPCLVSFGSNKNYDTGAADDIVLNF